MQYLVAFLIIVIVILFISFIGFLFSFLWPFILALIIVTAIGNLFTYRKRKKAMDEFYRNVQDTFEGTYTNQQNNSNTIDSDVIDVEFTETDADQ